MKRLINLLTILILISSVNLYSADKINGKISGIDENNSPIPLNKATIVWQNTQVGTLTDRDGEFSLKTVKETNKLIISYVGYKTDTIEVKDFSQRLEINLKSSLTTDEIRVVAKAPDQVIDKSSIDNRVTITSKGLQKAACCNLAESFVTSAAAEVEYSDAMSGARQIKLLGLKGTYTQLQTENIPSMRGLASSFGLEYIPGPWMESVSISKGASSVVNGFESITGQINIEFKKPEDMNPTHFNFYGDQLGRIEGNSYASYLLSPELSTMMFLHASTHQAYHDFNNDGFIDHPEVSQINAMNRWKYQGEMFESVTMASAVYEGRKAGQKAYLFDSDPNSYGMDISTTRVNLSTKNGFILDPDAGSSIGTILSFTHHKQNSNYGRNLFDAQQNSFYANFLYAQNFASDDEEHHHDEEHEHSHDEEHEEEFNIIHKVTAGLSFQYDNYFHNLNNTYMGINEVVPGVFAEYSFLGLKNFVFTGGLRYDEHNIYGGFVTPRLNAKYSLEDLFTLRASIGKGTRTPYAIAENSYVLASSREILFDSEIKREEATSIGASFTTDFELAGIFFTFNTDYYNTNFINQLIIDMDRNSREINFYNLEGKSYSNSIQFDLIAELNENVTLTGAYRFNEVKQTMNGELLDKPFQSIHKGFLNAALSIDDNNWLFDFTIEYNGGGRIPNTQNNPEQYRLPESFDGFFMLHGNIVKKIDNFEIYLGGENLLDFVQSNPIIAANDPFGMYFDSSMIWGPIVGRTIYLGVRYNIN